MGIGRSSFTLLLITLWEIYAFDPCKKQVYLNSIYNHEVQTKNLLPRDCSEIYFEGNEKLNAHLGSVSVATIIDEKEHFFLNISFNNIKWTKAHVKLSEINKPETSICKLYTAENQLNLPIIEVYDLCLNLNHYNDSVDYELEFKAELHTDILYKHIVFRLPSIESFENFVPLPKRMIFTSVDTSSNYEIILKIQNLPTFYNVSYYKVEVFRVRDNNENMLDVRMIRPGTKNEVAFEHVTYNEEGHYFFKVSAVNDVCPENACLKSLSPKVYIRRKYPPLVIGIVGASFLIPFILFIFHMWNRRSQLRDESEMQKDKVFIVYNQTPEKHYTIVKSLEKSLKCLTNVQIMTKITEATHIIYVCGTHIFEPDPATHKFLVLEANKAISNLEIYVVTFPYSIKEIPPYLKNCLKFDLMDDFGKLIHIFNCDAEYEGNAQYQDISSHVKAAQIQTEPKKITLNMPIIIVTEQSDSSDTEPKEGDVLL